jgi:hypothetical protein
MLKLIWVLIGILFMMGCSKQMLETTTTTTLAPVTNTCEQLAINFDKNIAVADVGACNQWQAEGSKPIMVGGTLINISKIYSESYQRNEFTLTFKGSEKTGNIYIGTKLDTVPYHVGNFYEFDIMQKCRLIMSAASSGMYYDPNLSSLQELDCKKNEIPPALQENKDAITDINGNDDDKSNSNLLNEIYLSGNHSKCNALNDIDSRDVCIQHYAISEQNVGLCNTMSNIDAKDGCMFYVAEKANNPSYCDGINKKNSKNQCYDFIIHRTNNIEDCDLISSNEARYFCMKRYKQSYSTSFNKAVLDTCFALYNRTTNKTIIFIGKDPYSRIMMSSITSLGREKFVILNTSLSEDPYPYDFDPCLIYPMKYGVTPQLVCPFNGNIFTGLYDFNINNNTQYLQNFLDECNT